jgi:hypothetical protein
VLCADGNRLAVARGAQTNDVIEQHGWRMSSGWAIIEHPGRCEHMMYLFGADTQPQLLTWLGAHAMILSPSWPYLPVHPGESIGYSLALTAGERCGAGSRGAWVACRTAMPGGGVRCAAVARLRDVPTDSMAAFRLGEQTLEVPLQKVLVAGVGDVFYALAEFSEGQMDDPLDVTVAGISSRR